ncbi:dTMP kinase [Streptomyces sp. NPDC008121]|uniref:dTMP kinase n=1 Tax=Streptomyces sp. NPDC008121 TaxID=3364809 RepID=UPI0036F0FD8A
MTGRLITLDGPGGIGKSTTHAALAAALQAAGHTVYAATQPSANIFGQTVRALGGEGSMRGRALALAVSADRHYQLDTEIRPALAAGHTVVLDRYLPSTLVLQRADCVEIDWILTLNEGIDVPDLAVILTSDPETIHSRLEGRGTRHRFERSPDDTRRELRFYIEAVPVLERLGFPVLTVDVGTLTPAGVADRILTHVPAHPATVNATDHHLR